MAVCGWRSAWCAWGRPGCTNRAASGWEAQGAFLCIGGWVGWAVQCGGVLCASVCMYACACGWIFGGGGSPGIGWIMGGGRTQCSAARRSMAQHGAAHLAVGDAEGEVVAGCQEVLRVDGGTQLAHLQRGKRRGVGGGGLLDGRKCALPAFSAAPHISRHRVRWPFRRGALPHHTTEGGTGTG